MSEKIRPPLNISGDIGKVLQDIYTQLNMLNGLVHSPNQSSGAEKISDAEGSIKVTKESPTEYNVSVKHADGWITTKSDTMKFKE